MWVSKSVKEDFKTRYSLMVQAIKSCMSPFDYTFGIFGSYARNDFTALSDIDFCIIADDIPRSVRGELSDYAEEYRCDITFLSKDSFANTDNPFINNVRKDFKPYAENQ